MRLSENEINFIRAIVCKYFGRENSVFLFGSRLDDRQRGGDIDLFVQTALKGSKLQEAKLNLMTDLQIKWGDQKIDVITANPKASIFSDVVKEALRTGVRL